MYNGMQPGPAKKAVEKLARRMARLQPGLHEQIALGRAYLRVAGRARTTAPSYT